MDQTPSLLFSKRFFVALTLFIAFISMGIIQSNVNIALVEMTSNKSVDLVNYTIVRPAEFQWDPSQIGLITSITYVGGLFSLTSTIFVRRLGGSVCCAFFTMLCGILSIIEPASLYTNFTLFIVLRLLTGFFSISVYVTASETFTHWFPKRERSTLITFCIGGANVGFAIASPLFGFIADRLRWQMVFYISGTICLVASLLIYIFVKNQPTQDVWISKQELAYILDGTQETSQKKISHRSHPYKEILTSSPVWALCVVQFIEVWIRNLITVCLPLYAKDMTGGSTDEVGLISGIPATFIIIMYPLIGRLLDYCRNHTHIDGTLIDKTIIGSTFLFISVLFAACAFFSNFTISVTLFVFIQIAASAPPAVFDPNIINIAPNDSHVVCALTKICSCIGLASSRILTGFMTMNHTPQEWNNSFFISSGAVIAGGVIFIVFGSSEAQSWSLLSNTEDECDYLIKDKNESKRV